MQGEEGAFLCASQGRLASSPQRGQPISHHTRVLLSLSDYYLQHHDSVAFNVFFGRKIITKSTLSRPPFVLFQRFEFLEQFLLRLVRFVGTTVSIT